MSAIGRLARMVGAPRWRPAGTIAIFACLLVPGTAASGSPAPPSAQARDQRPWNRAYRHGLVSARTAERAIQRAVHAIEGLSKNHHDLHRWLADSGIELTWRDTVA